MTLHDVALGERHSIVMIGDRVEGWPPHGLSFDEPTAPNDGAKRWAHHPFVPAELGRASRDGLDVVGGYLEGGCR